MDNVQCTGTETNLGHCKHSGWADSDCSENDLAAVDCTGTANPRKIWSLPMQNHDPFYAQAVTAAASIIVS